MAYIKQNKCVFVSNNTILCIEFDRDKYYMCVYKLYYIAAALVCKATLLFLYDSLQILAGLIMMWGRKAPCKGFFHSSGSGGAGAHSHLGQYKPLGVDYHENDDAEEWWVYAVL